MFEVNDKQYKQFSQNVTFPNVSTAITLALEASDGIMINLNI